MTLPLRLKLALGGALGLFMAVVAPLLAQDAGRTPLAIGSARISLAGTSNLHDWTASTTTVRLTQVQSREAVTTDLAALAKPGVVQAFEIAVPATSLHSPKDGLDKNMHKALKAPAYPEIVFKLTRLDARQGGLRAVGQLRIAGVEKEVAFDLTTHASPGKLAVSGSVDLLMTDFGIPAPKALMGMLKTDPKVTVSFETVLAVPLT